MTACLSHCHEAPALLLQLCSIAKEGTQLVENSPALLPDVGLGPRVGLPGRRQPAGYGTSWSVLVSSTSGRSGSSPNLFSPFPSTNPSTPISIIDQELCNNIRRCLVQDEVTKSITLQELQRAKE